MASAKPSCLMRFNLRIEILIVDSLIALHKEQVMATFQSQN